MSKPTEPKDKPVRHSRGRHLMRQMVRYLEARYGNPPRPIYAAAKGNA